MKRITAIISIAILIAYILLFWFGFCLCANTSTYKIPLSRHIQNYAWEFEKEYKVAAPLLMSLVYEESKGNPDAKNGKHIGLTQINPKYFKHAIKELGLNDLTDPYQNMKLCAYTLSNWFEIYSDEDVYLILEMWNKGEQRALIQHRKDKPSKYAKRIADRAEEWTIYYEEDLKSRRPIY